MKNLQQYKSFFTGLLVGLLLISGGTYATTTGAGTIGSLFERISSLTRVGDDVIGEYRLSGDKVKNETIDDSEIEDDSLTAISLAENSVGNSELAVDAVTSTNIVDNSITQNDLADNSVSSVDIVDNSITSIDLGPNSVGNDELNNSQSFSMQNIRAILGRYYIGSGEQRLSGDGAQESFLVSNSSVGSVMKLLNSSLASYGGMFGFSGGIFGLQNRGNWIVRSVQNVSLSLLVGGSERLSILNNGNVGIGTTSPSQRLDIDGKIRMRAQTNNSDLNDTVATKGYVDSRPTFAGVSVYSTRSNYQSVSADDGYACSCRAGDLRTGCSGISTGAYDISAFYGGGGSTLSGEVPNGCFGEAANPVCTCLSQ